MRGYKTQQAKFFHVAFESSLDLIFLHLTSNLFLSYFFLAVALMGAHAIGRGSADVRSESSVCG